MKNSNVVSQHPEGSSIIEAKYSQYFYSKICLVTIIFPINLVILYQKLLQLLLRTLK